MWCMREKECKNLALLFFDSFYYTTFIRTPPRTLVPPLRSCPHSLHNPCPNPMSLLSVVPVHIRFQTNDIVHLRFLLIDYVFQTETQNLLTRYGKPRNAETRLRIPNQISYRVYAPARKSKKRYVLRLTKCELSPTSTIYFVFLNAVVDYFICTFACTQ